MLAASERRWDSHRPFRIDERLVHGIGNDEESIEYGDVVEQSIGSRFEVIPMIELIRILQRIRKRPSVKAMVTVGILEMGLVIHGELNSRPQSPVAFTRHLLSHSNH